MRLLSSARIVILSLAVVVAVAACSDDDTVETSPGDESSEEQSPQTTVEDPAEGPAPLPFGLVRCPTEPQRVTAPEDQYRDEPVYVGNPPTEDLQAWAETKPGFEGLWIDRTHNGWITLAFSQDVEERRSELLADFPDVGVVAVGVDWTEAELMALLDQALDAMRTAGFDSGGGASVSEGLVSVSANVLDEEHLEPLAPFAGDRLCVEGTEPENAVIDGPQPTEGDDWRLLGTDRTGDTYRTGIATTDEQYGALWDRSGIAASAPDVDFDTEVVVWFGAVYGSGCEIRMDDVIVDDDQHLVHGEFVVPGNPSACNDDANPEAYVVAVERAALPPAPFAVQLGPNDPPSGVPEERTLVSVDLRPPGSMASGDDLGPDPELFAEAERGYVIGAGGVMEIGFPALYDLDLSCDFGFIGPINGVVWQAGTSGLGPDAVPEPWAGAADADGIVEIELLLSEAPPELTLTAGGHTESYGPAPTGTESACP